MSEQFDASRPIYAQLVERLKARILAGTYPPGGHLDSVRDLATAAGVNPNTMQRAMQELEARGLINTQRTAGRTITEDETMIQALRQQKAQEQIAQFWAAMQKLGFTQAEALSLLKQTKENA